MEGWFKTHRRLLDSLLWLSEPFTKGQAWVDLIGLATFEYTYFYVRGVKVELERGQVGWSEPKLADRWKWSRTKLRKFLNDLEKEQQIIQQKNNVNQVITIVNYEIYQEKEQQSGQQKNSRKTYTRMNKNEEEVIVNTITTWRDDFLVYKKECHSEFSRLRKDENFLKKLQYFHPNVNIQKTIDKAYETYWSTEDAWKYKKKQKVETINWDKTITNAISQSFNKVYYTKQELAEI